MSTTRHTANPLSPPIVAIPATSADAHSALHAAAIAADDYHLRDLIMDEKRCADMTASFDGITLDYSRQRLDSSALAALRSLYDAAGVQVSVDAMFSGEKINRTENRAVLHTALRAPEDLAGSVVVDGQDCIADVHAVLKKIKTFSERVRSGNWVGATGKTLVDVVAVGIGGSYLGPEFVFEAVKKDKSCLAASEGRRLRFLANVDPVDVARAAEGLDPETTLVVIVSKTFTTAETMLNARTMRKWICDKLGSDAVAKHFCAISTSAKGVSDFGIDTDNMFGFWDWVGGRFSVCSAVGALPLALQYGYPIVEQFLAGAHSMDIHFQTAPVEENIPAIMGLVGVWNSTFLGYATRALLPYSQALLKLAPHIQQVDMESNGKRVTMEGASVGHECGPINFGEPGTNGQHSFYQLVHQGRTVPADFVGFINSQSPVDVPDEKVSNHDELMSNFFAQPDALAAGKSAEQCRVEGVPEELVPHKTFPGNRPSSSLLLPCLTPRTTGQLLSLFEHRTAVEGFVWGINSFDQWGVELGKILATNVRNQLAASRAAEPAAVFGFNPSTTSLLNLYLGNK
jgi:glucose-6-phosphate isomerase